MSLRSVSVLRKLLRLAKDELEQRRRELVAIDGRLAEVLGRREALRRAVPAEIAAAWTLPGGPGPLAAWLAANREGECRLAREAEELAAQREHAAAAVEAQRAIKRRHELLLERALAAEWAIREARARRELDELASLRRSRSQSAPG